MNPRFFLETSRLMIRLPMPEDTRALHHGVMQSLPTLARWMPRALKGQTQKQTREMIYTQMALFVQDDDYNFGMFRKTDGAFVGMLELSVRVPKIPSYEIGYWVTSPDQSQGYASEGALALLEFAFKRVKAKRVFLRGEPTNVASCRVAEKCGFTKEALLKNDALSADSQTVVDTIVYGHTPETWQDFQETQRRKA